MRSEIERGMVSGRYSGPGSGDWSVGRGMKSEGLFFGIFFCFLF